jgi:hypothetical protein
MPSTASIVTVEKSDKPTVRQVYALAAELCERTVVNGARSEASAPYCVHSLSA